MFSTSGKSFKNADARKRAEDRYKRELKRRLELRNRIYKVQTDAFDNGNKIASHYLQQDVNLPIWAIFELLSLGEFGHFVSCLNSNSRHAISRKIGIQQSDDSNGMLPQRLIYAIKDLRNAIAHNDVVFDTRFRTNSIDKQVSNAILNSTGVSDITFETITDYLVLMVYQLMLIGTAKTELKKFVSSFISIIERLRGQIPTSIYNQIIHTDNIVKITLLKEYISR